MTRDYLATVGTDGNIGGPGGSPISPSLTGFALAAAAVVATTNLALTGLQTVDGYTLLNADRILLTGQTTKSQNGVWAASSGSWTRPTDFASGAVFTGSRTVQIVNGTVNGRSTWLLATNNVTVDTTAQVWQYQLNAAVVAAGRLVVLPAPSGGDDAAILNPIIAACTPGSKVISAPGTYLLNSGSLVLYPGVDYDFSLSTFAQSASPGTAMVVNYANTSAAITATATDVDATGQTNAQWTVTAGSATGGSGTWSFVWNGSTYTTPAIAYNASALTVQAAILAATTTNNVRYPNGGNVGSAEQPSYCTGGALGSASVVCTFQYDVSGPVTSFQVATNSYTGGTGPSFSSTTAGVVGNTYITSSTLSAVAVTGYGISIDQAGLQPDNPILTAVVGSVVGTQINLVDPAFGQPVSVITSVTNGSGHLVNRDTEGISIRGGKFIRSDQTAGNFTGSCITSFKWIDGLKWDGAHLEADPSLMWGSEVFKYAVQLGQAVNFVFTDTTLFTISDGIHMEGNCYNGTVRTVRGVTGDDGVALTPSQYPGDSTTRGNISHIDISDIHINPYDTGAAVAIYGGPCTSTQHVSIRGIYGIFSNGRLPVKLGAGVWSQTIGGLTDLITISEVHAISGSDNSAITINSPCAGRITIDGFYFDSGPYLTGSGIVVTPAGSANYASVDHLAIRNVRATNLQPSGSVLAVNNARIGRATFDNWDVLSVVNATPLIIQLQGTNPSIGRMLLSNFTVEAPGNSMGGTLINTQVGNAFGPGTSSLGPISMTNMHLHNLGNICFTSIPNVIMHCHNVEMRGFDDIMALAATASGCRVEGSLTCDQTQAGLSQQPCNTSTVGAQSFPAVSGIFNVQSTTGAPSSGTIASIVGVTGSPTYTGITPTSFTGVSGGTGTATNGGLVITALGLSTFSLNCHNANLPINVVNVDAPLVGDVINNSIAGVSLAPVGIIGWDGGAWQPMVGAFDRALGQTGYMAPDPIIGGTATTMTAGRLYLSRFVPSETFTATKISWAQSAGDSSGSDAVDAGIYSASGSTLNLIANVSGGAGVTGKLNATGMITITITSALLQAGTPYYAACVMPTSYIGSAPSAQQTSDNSVGEWFGSSVPQRVHAIKASVGVPLPSQITSGLTTSTNALIMCVRE